MAVTLNIKKTSYPSFTIGKSGATIYQGSSLPINGSGISGDIYIYSNSSSSAIYQNQNGTWSASAGGGVTSIIAGTDLTGGTITTSGTLNLASQGGLTAGTYQGLIVNNKGIITSATNKNFVVGTANNYNNEIPIFNGTTGTNIGPSGVTINSNQAVQILKNSNNIKNSTYTSWGTTTNSTQTEIFQDGSSARIVLNNNTTVSFEINIVGRATGINAGSNYIANYFGAITRNSNASTTSLVGDTISNSITNPNSLPWTALIDADTTNGALRIQVTGQASTNIIWGATIKTIEVTG